jgi:uncharacterized LabA/DUF88 family protein
MTTKHPDQRVGIFIDAQNLYHSSKNLYGARINYKELIKHLVADRKLIRALAYVVKAEPLVTAEQQHKIEAGEMVAREKTTKSEGSFFDALKQSGVELRMKDIQIFAGGAKKADWDVGMAIDAVRMADMLDVVILVTGDGDFIPLVEYLKWGRGREVEICSFNRSTNGKLKESGDEFIPIEDLPRVIMRKPQQLRGNRRDTSPSLDSGLSDFGSPAEE